MFEKALDIASTIRYYSAIIEALSAIEPYFDGRRKKEVIEKAFDIASEIGYDDERAKALSSIVPYLDDPKKEEIIEKALDNASRIEADDKREKSLQIILLYLRYLPIDKLYFWWKRIIQTLREHKRSSLLLDIIILIPLINELGGDETLFEISQAIKDTSRWWP